MTRIDPARQGNCYPLAYLRMLDLEDENLRLAHGTINGGNTNHAWIVTLNEAGYSVKVWDPVLDRSFSYTAYLTQALAAAEIVYTREEALRLFNEKGHYGPWHETGLPGALTTLSAALRDLGASEQRVREITSEIEKAASESAASLVSSLRIGDSGAQVLPNDWRSGWGAALTNALGLIDQGMLTKMGAR